MADYQAPEAYHLGDDRSTRLRSVTGDFGTDWTIHAIGYDEIQSGGVGKDGIPAINAPEIVRVTEMVDAEWLQDPEPVVAVFVDGQARAYPLQILMWHEIVNDEIAGVPVAATYCPLCNAALAFDRRVHGEVLEFGVSGLLRHSDLIMFDRATDSLWQQIEGRAIAGQLTGTTLDLLPSLLVSWGDYRAAYPQETVMVRPTSTSRRYGENPYQQYDEPGQRPFLFAGEADPRLEPVSRVVAVAADDVATAYPFSALEEQRVVNDTVGGRPITVWWQPGTVSPLDAATIAEGRDVGAAAVFDRRVSAIENRPIDVDAETLTFRADGDFFVDDQTESRWDMLGRAEGGDLAGARLAIVEHANQFWFAWAAFRPDTDVWSPAPGPR